MFSISQKKGFHMVFPNGWTVSVQFGPGNYGSNYNLSIMNQPDPLPPSSTAEIAAWPAEGEWFRFDDGDMVQGYQTPLQVLAFMNQIAAIGWVDKTPLLSPPSLDK